MSARSRVRSARDAAGSSWTNASDWSVTVVVLVGPANGGGGAVGGAVGLHDSTTSVGRPHRRDRLRLGR
jgi:hypothetical protein